jgi:hypothetical protein
MRCIFITTALLIAPLVAVGAESPASSPAEEARTLTLQFVQQLKPQLKKAINERGPAGAIEVCATIAPAIAAELGRQSGWDIRRVSLRPRNVDRAEPDPWEQKVLYEFNRRQIDGEDAQNIFFGEEVDGRYRFMQAQGVEPLCLVCHGKGLRDDVQAALKKHYPEDWATGYSLGEVRGAISVSKPLQPPPAP